MLKLENLTIRFGGLTAVDNVTTHVEQGEIFGLVGPNGAGKTTTFNMISGYYAPTRGKVIFDGQEIQGKPQYEINRLGIARTYQNINLFNKMTVLENCMIGCHPRMKANIFDAIFNTPRKRREDADAEEKCRKILKFMDLGHREDYLAKNLSYGEQRRLEIARALVSDPKLLLLDEPAAGLISTTFGSPRDLHFCRNISISMAGALLAMDLPNRFLLRGFPVFSDITVFFARCVREDHSIFST